MKAGMFMLIRTVIIAIFEAYQVELKSVVLWENNTIEIKWEK